MKLHSNVKVVHQNLFYLAISSILNPDNVIFAYKMAPDISILKPGKASDLSPTKQFMLSLL